MAERDEQAGQPRPGVMRGGADTHVDPKVVEEIEAVVLERGSLSQTEIQSGWALSPLHYREYQRAISGRGRVVAGPPRVGGFRARSPGGPASVEGDVRLLREGWEEEVVRFLCGKLSHSELEELLGDLVYTVRHSRAASGLGERRGTKGELATALVIKHERDLFADTDVRHAVGRAAGVEVPKRWHPGKAAPVAFIERLGLPRMLAGIQKEETPPSYELLEGRFELRPLLDFQKKVSEQLRERLKRPGHRCIVTLPTGAGKTRVAVEAIRDWLFDLYDPQATATRHASVLWLAHTEELCEQAYLCFRQVWEGSYKAAPLLLVRFWGRYTREQSKHQEVLRHILERPSVLVSTPNRMVRLLEDGSEHGGRVSKELRAGLGLLVVDEAHRAAAPSYRVILDRLPDAKVPVVGLTATPFAKEYVDPTAGTVELVDVFRELLEPVSLGPDARAALQAMEVLARPEFTVIATKTPMRMPSIPDTGQPTEEDIARIDQFLAFKADNSRRRFAIIRHVVPLAQDPRNLILYFGPSVADAQCMAFLLRERNIPAGVISGTTREVTRRLLVERFRRRELRVLCNCEVLTTGFDAPKVTHIVMARPTVSQVLYEQMVGRGLRGPKFGGTERCVILDCQDDFRGPERPELGYRRFRRLWNVQAPHQPS